MTSLAEISLMGREVEDALLDSGGEVTPEIEQMMSAVNLAERDKVDSYIFYLKALEGDCEKWKKLEQEFAAKRKTAESRIDWMKQNVRGYMEGHGTTHLAGDLWKGFKLVDTGKRPVEVLVPPEELPRELTNVVVTPNKEKIRAELLAGSHSVLVDSTIARLGEPTLALRIF